MKARFENFLLQPFDITQSFSGTERPHTSVHTEHFVPPSPLVLVAVGFRYIGLCSSLEYDKYTTVSKVSLYI